MVKVFLSHTTADKPFVRILADDLRTASIGVWLDELEILVGDSLISRVSEGLTSCTFVVACLSRASIQSAWVREELEIAATKGIVGRKVVVLPLRLDDCAIPAYLAHRRYCDFSAAARYDAGFRELTHRLNPEAVPQLEYSHHALTFDASRKDRFVRASRDPQVREWVLDYVIDNIASRPSHKERHFMYLALGEIGGSRAQSVVERGLRDSNDFARSGAEQSWQLLSS